MPTFIETCQCKGKTPSGTSSIKRYSRPAITNMLLKERSYLRCLVAPEGFGKTSCAIDYAKTIFSFKNVFWIKCSSPCFIRDLDSRSIFDSIAKCDANAKLVVLDDLPQMDEERSEKLIGLIDELLDAGIEAMCTCTPSCYSIGSLDGRILKIDAYDLLLSEEELSFEVDRGSVAFETDAEKLKARIPFFAWHSCEIASRFGMRSEELPSQTTLIAMLMLLTQRGSLDELGDFIDTKSSMEAYDYLQSSYPFLGIDMRCNSYDSVHMEISDLAAWICNSIEKCVQGSIHESADSLCKAIGINLLEHEMPRRACEFMNSFASKSTCASWISCYGNTIMSLGDVLSLVGICDNCARELSSHRADVDPMLGAAHFLLEDFSQARRYVGRVCKQRDPKAPMPVKAKCLSIGYAISNEKGRKDMAFEMYECFGSSKAHHEPSEDDGIDWIGLCKDLSGWYSSPEDATGLLCAYANKSDVGSEHALACAMGCMSLLDSIGIIKHDDIKEQATSMLPSLLGNVLAYLKGTSSKSPASVCDHMISALVESIAAACSAQDLGQELYGLLSEMEGPIGRFRSALFSQRQEYKRLMSNKADRIQEYDITHPNIFRKAAPAKAPSEVRKVAVPDLYVGLIGGVRVKIGDRYVDSRLLSRKKTIIVLALLVANNGREISRNQIAEMLWPEKGMDAYTKNFYGIWSQLKKALSIDGRCPYLIRTQSGCRLDTRYLHSDVFELRDLCKTLMFASNDKVSWEALYERASIDFSGEFLPGEMENEHILAYRDKFATQLTDGLVAASSRLNEAGEHRGATWFAREAVRRCDVREDAYIALMEAQISSNQRAAALETYFLCRKKMTEKLGIDPSLRTIDLYKSIIEEEEVLA